METSLPLRTEIQPDVWLDSRLALWLARLRLLVVADLHWGYAVSHRARGNLLPLWGDEEIAERLRSLERDYRPDEIVWLGDTVHAVEGRAAAERFLATAATPVVLVGGNHDRQWRYPTVRSVERGGYFFHHGDEARPVPNRTIEVVGHHHPAASWADGAGTSLKLPALVSAPHRLILPAFSPWAAGTPWNRQLQSGETLWAVASRRIFAVSPVSHSRPSLSA